MCRSESRCSNQCHKTPRCFPKIMLTANAHVPASTITAPAANCGTRALTKLPAAALVAGCLSDPDKDVRHWAAWMMMHFKGAARPHIPALLKLVDDSDPHVRAAASSTLGRLKLEPALVVPVLANKLTTDAGISRVWTAVALRSYGGELEKARPGLLATLGTLGKKEFEAQQEYWRKTELKHKR